MDILIEARKKAELATEGMTDPDLRRTAFGVILKHLLEQSSPGPQYVNPHTRSFIPNVKASTTDNEHEAVNPRSTGERILVLRGEGFFQTGKGIGEVRDELQAHGWMYALTAISGPLMKLVRQRELRRMMAGDGKKSYKYFNP
jgi:hypothetical protein